jgi:hypothetical protein
MKLFNLLSVICGILRANKKTRKREKYLENIKKAHRKKKKKDKAPQFNFSALHLIHDPQVGGRSHP